MNERFVDTSYWLALLNKADEAFAQATKLAQQDDRKLITTQWVLVELGNAMSRQGWRGVFTGLFAKLHATPNLLILPADPQNFQQGYDLYQARPDKEWSLTDCISFEIMRELQMTEALTSDHHFVQAGFVALLRNKEI